MPTQNPDFLQPGESLLPGEFLVSTDERFRLYLEEDGNLVAYAYRSDYGVQRFWNANVHSGPGSRLQFTVGNGRFPSPFVEIVDASDVSVWIFPKYNPAHGWDNVAFRMQSDGNIVHYAREQGVVRDVGATGTNGLFPTPTAIPPNTIIVEIPTVGSINTQPGAGDADIVNDTNKRISVRDSSRVVSVPPGESISANIPGTLAVGTHSYDYANLRAPDGTRPEHNSLDSITVNPPTGPGERRRVVISVGGHLTVGGLFSRSNSKSLSDIKISGKAGMPFVVSDDKGECVV